MEEQQRQGPQGRVVGCGAGECSQLGRGARPPHPVVPRTPDSPHPHAVSLLSAPQQTCTPHIAQHVLSPSPPLPRPLGFRPGRSPESTCPLLPALSHHLPSILARPQPSVHQHPPPAPSLPLDVMQVSKGHRKLLLQEALPDSTVNRHLPMHEHPSTRVPGLIHLYVHSRPAPLPPPPGPATQQPTERGCQSH